LKHRTDGRIEMHCSLTVDSRCVVNVTVSAVALATGICIGFQPELQSPRHWRHFHRLVVCRLILAQDSTRWRDV